jgi:hypothetical protein
MDVNLWEGGTAFLPDCGECKVSICPAPHKMAAHRRRAPYNMGAAFDYQCDPTNQVCYDLLLAGDTLWLALIPEDALLEGIRVKVSEPDAINQITFSVVAETITLEDCGTAVTTPIVLPVSLTGLNANALLSVWAQISPMLYTQPYGPSGREGIRIGLVLTTLPVNGLPSFRGRIELTAVARDLETVTVANCRLNGPCVIANP